MRDILGLVTISCLIITTISIYLGTKRWIKISGVSAFLVGLTSSLALQPDLNGFWRGVLFGTIFSIFAIWSAWNSRKIR